MKKLCLILAAAGLFFSCQPKKTEPVMETKKDALSVIHARKSVREYVADKQVSKEDLETIIKAGMAAPSARNIQPWHFVVVSDAEIMNNLAEQLPYAKMLTEASAAIIVCGDTAASPMFWMIDCSAATQNVLLAAEALGLGAVWTAAWPAEDRMNAVKTTVDLPDHILPLCVIPMGYPANEEAPKDKFDAEKIHWEKF